MNDSKGQAWSIDLIIAVLIFGLIMVIFYTLITADSEPKIEQLNSKASALAEKIFNMGLVDQVTGELNDTVFVILSDKDYEELRGELGVVGDFCLFIETNDLPAQIMFIQNRSSIGSEDFNLSGYKCGYQIS